MAWTVARNLQVHLRRPVRITRTVEARPRHSRPKVLREIGGVSLIRETPLVPLELVAQTELHHARIRQCPAIRSEISGACSEIKRFVINIEAHGIGDIECFPAELDLLF